MGDGLRLEEWLPGSKSPFILFFEHFFRTARREDGQIAQARKADKPFPCMWTDVTGSISTNRLNRKELETFIKNGIDSTRYLAKDEARVLADPSRYYKGGKPDLKLYDAKFASLNPDDKIEMAKARSGRSTRQGRTDHLCRFFLWRWRGLCLPPDQQWFRRRNQKYVVLTFCRHHDQRGRRGASFCLLV